MNDSTSTHLFIRYKLIVDVQSQLSEGNRFSRFGTARSGLEFIFGGLLLSEEVTEDIE